MLDFSTPQSVEANTPSAETNETVGTVDFRQPNEAQPSETPAPPATTEPVSSPEIIQKLIALDHQELLKLGTLGFQVKIEEHDINGGQNGTNQSNN